MNYRFLCLCVIGISFSGVVDASPNLIDIRDIPSLVREHNRHAVGADLLRQAAEVQRGHLMRSYLPEVSIRGGYEGFKTGSQRRREEPFGGIEARLNIYRGGRDSIDDEIVNNRAEISTFEYQETYREEVKKAETAFWNLVAAHENIAVLNTAISQNESISKAALERVKAGIATDTDKLEFEMYQLELERELARAKLAVQSSRLEMFILLGIDPQAEVDTPKYVPHEASDELLQKELSISDHPQIRARVLKIEEAKLMKERAARWWTPTVDLYASRTLSTFREREFEPDSERDERVVGAQISMNLFNGFGAQVETAQKSLETAGLKAEKSQFAQELEVQILNAKAALKLTHDLVTNFEKTLAKSAKYMEQTLDEYRRGVKNSPDVLSAMENYLDIRKKFLQLRLDYQLARTELLSILGG